MRLKAIILFAMVVLCCLAAAASVSLAEEDQPTAKRPSAIARLSARLNFKMPPLFDFAKYKAQFHKGYRSVAEEMRRAKLFMARAFAVFIAGIKYMHWQSSMYLKINSKSDWTDQERLEIMNLEDDDDDDKAAASNESAELDDNGLIPAAELEDIEHTFEEIVANKDDRPEYAAIAAELEQKKRRKRDLAQPRRLTEDDQWGRRDQGELSPKYRPVVASNNPKYHQVELISQAAAAGEDDSELVAPLTESEAVQIDEQARLGGFLSRTLRSFKSSIKELLTDDVDFEDAVSSKVHVPDSEPKPLAKRGEESIDYRDSGCLLPVKDQGKCGACYIFAAIALYEYHHCMQTGKLVPFSEQYPLDCGTRSQLKGCKGGKEALVASFVGDYGLELMLNYPYRYFEQWCPYSNATSERAAMGHTRVTDWDYKSVTKSKPEFNAKLIERLLKSKGPLTIGIRIYVGFADYGGGVDKLESCKNTGGHAMTLIGQGVEDGLEYWLIRNSNGPDFGLDGHYKLSKTAAKECFVRVGYVEAKFVQNSNHIRPSSLADRVKEQMRLNSNSN